jgi:hypothetical protein
MSTIDCEIEELNVVILALLADIDVANDELKLLIDATLPLKVDAIDVLIEEDINSCDADKDELITATSKSVAITDNELLNDALTILMIDWEIEELRVFKVALLALNEVATDELKSPVTLAILALLAENDVATEELNVLMLPAKLIAVLPLFPNKYKVPLPLS